MRTRSYTSAFSSFSSTTAAAVPSFSLSSSVADCAAFLALFAPAEEEEVEAALSLKAAQASAVIHMGTV
jgi:hypothetical protein